MAFVKKKIMRGWMLFTGIAGVVLYLAKRIPARAPVAVLKKLAVDPATGRSRTKAQIRDAITVAIADIANPPSTDERRVLSHFLEVEAAAKAYRLEPALVAAMIHVESYGRSNLKTLEQQGFYTYGLMQIRGTTADLVSNAGLIGPVGGYETLRADGPSIFYGAAYLRWQMNRYRNKMLKHRWAVAAYQAGTAVWNPKKRRFDNEDYVMYVVDRRLPRYVYLFHQVYNRVGRATFRGLAAFEDLPVVTPAVTPPVITPVVTPAITPPATPPFTPPTIVVTPPFTPPVATPVILPTRREAANYAINLHLPSVPARDRYREGTRDYFYRVEYGDFVKKCAPVAQTWYQEQGGTRRYTSSEWLRAVASALNSMRIYSGRPRPRVVAPVIKTPVIRRRLMTEHDLREQMVNEAFRTILSKANVPPFPTEPVYVPDFNWREIRGDIIEVSRRLVLLEKYRVSQQAIYGRMPMVGAQETERRLRQRQILPASEKPVIVRPPLTPVVTPPFTPAIMVVPPPVVTPVVAAPVTPIIRRPPSMAQIVSQAVTLAIQSARLVIGPGGIAISPTAYQNLFYDAKAIADRLHEASISMAV